MSTSPYTGVEKIVQSVQIISQKRISERIIEVCPCARASEFERDRRVAPASRLDGTSRCETSSRQTVDVLTIQIMETIVEALELSSRSGFLRGFVSAQLFDKLMSCKMLSS